MKMVLTCEHAFNLIPENYSYLFTEDPEVLETHEAFDPGAYDLFQYLESRGDFSHFQNIGRLLIETNRSKWHKLLFSRFSKNLSGVEKEAVINAYYDPYRNMVQKNIQKLLDSGDEVLHISVHTFTPVLEGIERNCDIGLLYDPKSSKEKHFCKKWKDVLQENQSNLKIRSNYPYLGKSDGFTSALRKFFPKNYLGIELEVNQKWVKENKMEEGLKKSIFESLKSLK